MHCVLIFFVISLTAAIANIIDPPLASDGLFGSLGFALAKGSELPTNELTRSLASQRRTSKLSRTLKLSKIEDSIIVVSGPSGSGKSVLLKMLMAEFPNRFDFCVSHTTRQPRKGELHGVDYYFIERDQMERDIAAEKFVESAEFSGNFYGTSREELTRLNDLGRIAIMDIEISGVRSLRKIGIQGARFVFVKPPDMATLEARLRGRGTETESMIALRMERARQDMKFGTTEYFDALIVNENLDTAYATLKKELGFDRNFGT